MAAIRSTQQPVETSIAPDNSKVRVTQEAVETSVAPDNSKIRVTQEAVETSIQSGIGKIRLTQIVIETSVAHLGVPPFKFVRQYVRAHPDPRYKGTHRARVKRFWTLPGNGLRRRQPNICVVT